MAAHECDNAAGTGEANLNIVQPSVNGEWIWFSSDQPTVINPGLPESGSCAMFLPSEHVLLTSVQIPKTRQALKIIPYAIEDQLLQDPDQTQIAASPLADNHYAVACVNKELYNSWQGQIQEQDVAITSILPDVLALYWASASWTIAVLQDRFLLRTGEHSGIAGALQQAEFILQHALENSDAMPEKVFVYNSSDAIDNFLNKSGLVFEKISTPFEQQRIDAPDINFSLKKSRQKKVKRDRRFKLTTSLLVLAVITVVGTQMASHVMENKAAQQLQAQIDSIVSSVNMGQAVDQDPLSAMQTAYQQLQHMRLNNVFLTGLQRIGSIIHNVGSVSLTSLKYTKNAWVVALSANSSQQQQLLAQLQASGYQVTQQNHTQKSFTIIITRRGSGA